MFALPGAIGDVPLGAVFAFVSIFALIALVVTALWRVKLNIRYETWHLSHIVLAVVAVAAGVVHMVGWAFYLSDPWKRDAVDRPDDLLDRSAALRAHLQTAVHAPPTIPRRGSAQGTR